MATNSKTFTTANDGVDISNYQLIDSGRGLPDSKQVVRFFATSADSSGSATIEMALYDDDLRLVIARFTGTSTITARRVGSDGASGDYICDVIWSETGNGKFDLLGAGPSAQWRFGLGVFTTANDMTFYWTETQVI